VSAGFGQTSTAPLAFEVASIKPAPPLTPDRFRSGQVHVGVKIDKAQADFGGMPLRDLIARAYGVRVFQISGPDELTLRWDILAKMPEGSTEDQAPQMLQTLLAERFGLKLHRDSKEFPVYALVVGKNGPKLTPRPPDYDPKSQSRSRPSTLENYANMITAAVDRPVVDQTGVKGEYMFSMDIMLNAMMARARSSVERQAVVNPGRPAEQASDPSDGGIFAAIQPLGLKLESKKLPMPILIVDHVEKTPIEN
jgi:uncharacterized protein (TIGR03435 family)